MYVEKVRNVYDFYSKFECLLSTNRNKKGIRELIEALLCILSVKVTKKSMCDVTFEYVRVKKKKTCSNDIFTTRLRCCKIKQKYFYP